MQQLERKN